MPELTRGDFFYCPKSGVVVTVVRAGNAVLSTEYGPMQEKWMDIGAETLELIDPDETMSVLAKDSPDRLG
ncbi:hypothetical protein [Roseibium album]|uniref:hypothetical protein n=1 Tax=Roseibium album TaxID=311410 RepID=UPI00249125B1|nr:hypothetical protein [Roseibium album]